MAARQTGEAKRFLTRGFNSPMLAARETRRMQRSAPVAESPARYFLVLIFFLANLFMGSALTSPAGADMQVKQLVVGLHERSRNPSFYLHETTHTFATVEHTIQALQPLDSQLSVRWAEHNIDLAIAKALQSHPWRTRNASAADIQIADPLLFSSCILAWRSTQAKQAKTAMRNHILRLDEFASQLESNAVFTEGRMPFIVAVGAPSEAFNGTRTCQLTSRLTDLFSQSNVLLGTTDKEYRHWRTPQWRGRVDKAVQVQRGSPTSSTAAEFPRDRLLVLPYRAHAALAAPSPRTTPDARTTALLFHGNIDRDDSGLRKRLVAAAFRLNESYNVSIESRALASSADQASHSEETARSARLMQGSELCLVPSGDTPSSRRLFDSLAAGCVPIVVVPFVPHASKLGSGALWGDIAKAKTEAEAEEVEPEDAVFQAYIASALPFSNAIDWRSIIFFHRMGATERASHVTLRVLHQLASPEMQNVRERMRVLGRAAFDAHMNIDYRPEGVVSALILESMETSRGKTPLVAHRQERRVAAARSLAAAGALASARGSVCSLAGRIDARTTRPKPLWCYDLKTAADCLSHKVPGTNAHGCQEERACVWRPGLQTLGLGVASLCPRGGGRAPLKGSVENAERRSSCIAVSGCEELCGVGWAKRNNASMVCSTRAGVPP